MMVLSCCYVVWYPDKDCVADRTSLTLAYSINPTNEQSIPGGTSHVKRIYTGSRLFACDTRQLPSRMPQLALHSRNNLTTHFENQDAATSSDQGYVNYFEVLGVNESAKPGEVRKVYRRKMKDLINEIGRVEVTAELRSRYFLEIAKLNAALLILRDTDEQHAYWNERTALIELEERWRNAAEAGGEDAEAIAREFDRRVRAWLSKYLEDMMLAAGRDKECVEASAWDRAHERHATRTLREFRHRQYRAILERLPFVDVSTPEIDWNERHALVASVLSSAE